MVSLIFLLYYYNLFLKKVEEQNKQTNTLENILFFVVNSQAKRMFVKKNMHLVLANTFIQPHFFDE